MPRFVGRNTSTTNYTLRAKVRNALTKNYGIGPGAAFDFYVDDVATPDIRTQLGTLAGVTFVEQDATEVVKLVSVAAPAAASTTGVHAAYAGNNASNTFPGPITNPAVPRNLTATFQASWDGGAITVTGTDQYGAVQTETLASNPGGSTTGVKVFKTVTSIVKAAVGASSNTASVGTGNKLGAGFNYLTGACLFVDGAVDATVTFDATNDGFTPSAGVVPNGSRSYIALVSG